MKLMNRSGVVRMIVKGLEVLYVVSVLSMVLPKCCVASHVYT
jgi:hypothetical protein